MSLEMDFLSLSRAKIINAACSFWLILSVSALETFSLSYKLRYLFDFSNNESLIWRSLGDLQPETNAS